MVGRVVMVVGGTSIVGLRRERCGPGLRRPIRCVPRSFNLEVVTHARIGLLGSPEDLSVNPGTLPGEVVSTWTKGVAIHGFLVQHATDPTNAATISPPIASTKPKLTLEGLTSNPNVSFPVAAIDPASPTGQSPWSAWVVGNAR